MRKLMVLIGCLLTVYLSHAQLSWQEPALLQMGLLQEEARPELSKSFPMKMVGGLIFLKAELGGVKGNFILDTGASTLIVNTDLKGEVDSKKRVLGICGYSKMRSRLIDDFCMGGLKTKPIDALDMDLSHLEKLIQHPINGLIGFEAISNYELLLDYEQEMMEMISPGGQPKQDLKEAVVIPFELMGHFPVIKVRIGKRDYHFGIDSGAEINLIAKKHKRRLRKRCGKKKVKKYLQGIDKGKVCAYAMNIDYLRIAEKDYENMAFTFTDISHINSSRKIKLDGILGYPFLKSQLFSINFKDQEIRIWKKAEMELPQEELMVRSEGGGEME